MNLPLPGLGGVWRFRSALAFATAVLLAWAGPRNSSAAVTLQIGRNFRGSVEGIDSLALPADANGAAGIRHYVEMVNGHFAVYEKTTGERVLSKADVTFWRDSGVVFPPRTSVSDPRTVYDSPSGRWFTAAIDVSVSAGETGANRFLLAVSESSDPTGAWHGLAFEADPLQGNFGDFPGLGIDAEGVYLSGELFTPAGKEAGSTLFTIPKSDLLLIPPSAERRHSFGALSGRLRGEILQPAVTTGAASTGGIVLAVASTGTDFHSHSNLFLTRLPAPTQASNSVLARSVSIAIPPYEVPINPAQPGGVDTLDNGDSRFGAAVQRVGDTAYAVHGVQLDDRAALQWYVVNAVTGSLIQSGVVKDPVLEFFYPSIAANEAGVVVIGFNGTSTNQFVSSYAVAGEGPLGGLSFGRPILLKSGLATYQEPGENGISRWGDYSATCLDPVDPDRFWTIQMIAQEERTWATHITEIITAPLLLRIADSGPNVRLTWPAGVGVRLQTTASVGTGAPWDNVAAAPSVANGTATLEVPRDGTFRFYRLIQE